MHSYLAAALQMTSGPEVGQNLTQLTELVDLAYHRGATLIGLPENFAFMGEEQDKIAQADHIAGVTEQCLRTLAQRFQVTLLAGGHPVPVDGQRVVNRAMVITPDGQVHSCYDKVHLFDVNLPDGNTYQESRTVVAGMALPPVYYQPELGHIGLSICYDVRFPELYRHLAKVGAEILFIPAAFTAYTGKDHWQVLLQARAIENTCYVLAPAQVGWHYPRRQTHGHALIIDPWGVVLADAGERPGVAMAEINPERLAQVRRQMPSLHHRVF
ncbi:carbon-nitrogen hydrolase family protein [Gloeomargarita lithophora]